MNIEYFINSNPSDKLSWWCLGWCSINYKKINTDFEQPRKFNKVEVIPKDICWFDWSADICFRLYKYFCWENVANVSFLRFWDVRICQTDISPIFPLHYIIVTGRWKHGLESFITRSFSYNPLLVNLTARTSLNSFYKSLSKGKKYQRREVLEKIDNTKDPFILIFKSKSPSISTLEFPLWSFFNLISIYVVYLYLYGFVLVKTIQTI